MSIKNKNSKVNSSQAAKELSIYYNHAKNIIQTRLQEFENIWKKGSEKDIFAELAFCLLTPQSKARVCWQAIERLRNNGLLYKGDMNEIRNELKGIRFKNKKAFYIVWARSFFSKNGKINIRSRLQEISDVNELREWLVKHIKGMGYKEASHFLRNIGFGKDIAILDRHILKNLKLFNVIQEIPGSLSRKKYLEIEKRMREFSKQIQIPMEHLDFVLWFKETGEVFK